MTAISVHRHFDVLSFVKKAKENGIKEEFAEYQAREIEQLAEFQAQEIEKLTLKIQEQNTKISHLEAKEPATKGDLELIKLELQKEIEVVRKEIEVVRKEIEVVRKDIEVIRQEIRQEISQSKIWALLIFGSGWVSMLAIVSRGFHWW
jgi:predicted RNase H-like nuclease (RuvC/YqgF family)